MNYWPAEITNLSECHQPLFKALEELRESGTITAKEHYGARGWALHHNFDLWRGTAPINASNHGIWISGAPWLSLHLWEHYLFTGDKEFLKKSWPVLRDCALFFTDYLIEDPETKTLISGPSNSPEQGGLVMGPTMDHQIIRDLFKATSQAARILGTDQELAAKLDAMRPAHRPEQDRQTRPAPGMDAGQGRSQKHPPPRLPPLGRLPRHRHHLASAGFLQRRPPVAHLPRRRRHRLVDGLENQPLGPLPRWRPRLHHSQQPAQAPRHDKGSMGGGGMYPNLFDAHPPFQIDGNFGATAGIAEMLLQSHIPANETELAGPFLIHLLPALPVTWPAGSVKGLKARGGLTVDIAWKNGKLTAARITPSTTGPITIRLGEKTSELQGTAGKPLVVNGAK